jgi:putative FmdB family regulatory protein
MPLYEYQCESCGVRFEVIQRFSDNSVDTCKQCGGKVQRLLSAPAIQFKGTGWYITDYARKGAAGADANKPSPSPASQDSTTPPASSESKGATTGTPPAGASATSTTPATSKGDKT